MAAQDKLLPSSLVERTSLPRSLSFSQRTALGRPEDRENYRCTSTGQGPMPNVEPA